MTKKTQNQRGCKPLDVINSEELFDTYVDFNLMDDGDTSVLEEYIEESTLRMIKVAELAEQAGEQQLVQNIHKEVKGLADAPISTRALQIENEVHEAALGNDLSFETILDYVAGGWGMTSAELLRRFPAAPRRGFDYAREEDETEAQEG